MVTWVWRIYGLFPLPETAFAPHRWSTFIPHEGHILAPYSWGTFACHSWGTDIALFTDYCNSSDARYNKPLQRLVCPCEWQWKWHRYKLLNNEKKAGYWTIAQRLHGNYCSSKTSAAYYRSVHKVCIYTKIKKYGLTHFLKIVPSNWRK